MRKQQSQKPITPAANTPVDWEGLRDAWSDSQEEWNRDTAEFFGVHVPKFNEETINY